MSTLRIPFAIAAAVAAALTPACRLERGEYTAAPAPPPPDVRAAAVEGRFRTVVEYARPLVYDTVPGAGDRQRLMSGRRCPPWAPGGDCRYGALARIEPQVDAHRIPDTVDLAAGRVVARIITEDSAYAKLNLRANDTTYWWIDRRQGRWRSVFLSSDEKRQAVIDTTTVWHPATVGRTYAWRQAIARFVWSERDEALWATCTMYGCCSSEEEAR
jgi:hypothetical protein